MNKPVTVANDEYFQELKGHFRTLDFFKSNSIDIFSEFDTRWEISRALLVLQAGLHRNIKLMDGLKLMLQSRNVLCAASIVRMQIDNCMRLNAPLFVPEDRREDCFLGVLQQKNLLRKVFIEVDGKKQYLLDGFLKDKLDERMRGTAQKYDILSGYIHLDESAFWTSVKEEKGTETDFVIGGEASEDFNPVLLRMAEWFGEYTIGQRKIMEDYKVLLSQSELELAKATSSLRGESEANDEAISPQEGEDK